MVNVWCRIRLGTFGRMLRALCFLSALAGAIVACGGSGDALSKEEFIAEGDAICRSFEEEGRALSTPASVEEVPAYLDEAIALARSTREDFAELDPPDDGEDVRDGFTSALDAGIASLEEAKAAAEAGEQEGVVASLQEAGQAITQANARARQYGFEHCGREVTAESPAP